MSLAHERIQRLPADLSGERGNARPERLAILRHPLFTGVADAPRFPAARCARRRAAHTSARCSCGSRGPSISDVNEAFVTRVTCGARDSLEAVPGTWIEPPRKLAARDVRNVEREARNCTHSSLVPPSRWRVVGGLSAAQPSLYTDSTKRPRFGVTRRNPRPGGPTRPQCAALKAAQYASPLHQNSGTVPSCV